MMLLLFAGCSGNQASGSQEATPATHQAPGAGVVKTPGSTVVVHVTPTPTATPLPVPPEAAAVAKAFYKAIQAKDYAKASSFLTADATLGGQALNQTTLTQIAQAANSMNGPITSFKFTDDASDHTLLIGSIMRNKDMVYNTHLHLKQQPDGSWKITTLDGI